MCGLCGLMSGGAHWSGELGTGTARRQERLRRIASLNRVLGHFRLSVEDFGGVSLILRNRTGRAEIVPDLGALCRVAATMTSKPFDPLDPALLAAMRATP